MLNLACSLRSSLCCAREGVITRAIRAGGAGGALALEQRLDPLRWPLSQLHNKIRQCADRDRPLNGIYRSTHRAVYAAYEPEHRGRSNR